MEDRERNACIPFETDIFDSIVEETSVDVGQVTIEDSSASDGLIQYASTVENRIQITSDLVVSICSEHAVDDNLSTARRSFFESIQAEPVLPAVGFMTACLMPAGKFHSATREKAWMRYHQEFLKHRLDVMKAIDTTAANAAFLCLKLFERLISLAYPRTSELSVQRQHTELTELDSKVVPYIGGCILRKQKERLPPAFLECLDAFQCEEESSPSLTTTLDRGGLTHLHQMSKELFEMLEVKFRDYTGQVAQSFSSTDFQHLCSSDKEITLKFEECLQGVDSKDKLKERLFSAIVSHYFRVRIHHECKLYMERLRSREASSKQSRAFRRGLKEMQ